MDAMIRRGLDTAIGRPAPATWGNAGRPKLPAIVVADQRKALRRRTDLPGYLLFEGQDATVSCRVCNLSATGAMIKLQVSATSAIAQAVPDRFTLVLTHYKQETRIACIAARHTGVELGVRFHGQFQTVTRQQRAGADNTRR